MRNDNPISMGIFVKVLPRMRCVATFTNIPYRNYDAIRTKDNYIVVDTSNSATVNKVLFINKIENNSIQLK